MASYLTRLTIFAVILSGTLGFTSCQTKASLVQKNAPPKAARKGGLFNRQSERNALSDHRGAKQSPKSDRNAITASQNRSVKKAFYTRPIINKRTKAINPKLNPLVLSQSNGRNTRVVIDVGAQRGYLLVNEKVAMDTPVSTARPGKYTPRGSFSIGQRVRSGKVSTIYGVEMPFWMRLGASPFGLHAGYLPGYPASAGCIRLPATAAQVIFDNTSPGTRVSIHSSWNGGV